MNGPLAAGTLLLPSVAYVVHVFLFIFYWTTARVAISKRMHRLAACMHMAYVTLTHSAQLCTIEIELANLSKQTCRYSQENIPVEWTSPESQWRDLHQISIMRFVARNVYGDNSVSRRLTDVQLCLPNRFAKIMSDPVSTLTPRSFSRCSACCSR